MSLHGGEDLDARALRIALEARELGRAHLATLTAHGDRLDDLEELVGRAPSALPGDKGTGLAQHLVDLTKAVEELRETMDADRKARTEEAQRLADARAPWTRAGWLAAGAGLASLVGAVVAGGLHWILTLHH